MAKYKRFHRDFHKKERERSRGGGFPISGREPVTIYTNSSWENVGEGDASEARWCVAAQSGFHPAERSDDRRLLLAPKGAHASERDRPRDARARNPGLIRFSS